MSDTAGWLRITQELPANGSLVDTRIDDWRGVRNQQQLKRSGQLWFIPDGSMYVYYDPTHFRYVKEKP